jgi:thiamine biosynthesis lipoprotein
MTLHSFRQLPRLVLGGTACCVVALTVGASGSPYPIEGAGRVTERQVYLMGTRATLLSWESSRADAVAALDRMLAMLEATERELSTWRSESFLSQLNRQPVDESREAPDSFCDLFGELTTWTNLSSGAFDPAVGSLVEVWGLWDKGAKPSHSAVESARARAGLEHFFIESAPCSITRSADTILDSGAFGKGAALDRVASLGESGMVDLGGQLVVFGESPMGGWPVHIAHPRQRDMPVIDLRLTSGSLAVSGGSERDRWVNGERVGHIIDPRTGRPVSRSLSVAVWHERALAADAIATALYVMGIDEGRDWAEAHGIAACFVVPHGPGAFSSGDAVDIVMTTPFRLRFF